MGEDKAELLFNGTTFLQSSLNLLEATGGKRILLSGREGFPNSVADIIADSGPPGALYSCLYYLDKLDKLDNAPLLIIPIDMPFLDHDVLSELLNNMQDEDACNFSGEVFPCVLRASNKLFQHLDNLFQESHQLGRQRSMRAILKFCNSKTIDRSIYKEKVFMNINTVDDYNKTLINQI